MMEYYFTIPDEPNLDSEFSDVKVVVQDRHLDYLLIYDLYIKRQKL